MKKWFVVLAWAILPVAVVYAYNAVSSGISVNPPRYVIVETSVGVFKLNTENGDSWLWDSYSGLWRIK